MVPLQLFILLSGLHFLGFPWFVGHQKCSRVGFKWDIHKRDVSEQNHEVELVDAYNLLSASKKPPETIRARRVQM